VDPEQRLAVVVEDFAVEFFIILIAALVWMFGPQRVDITIDIDYHETGEHFREQFSEYSYTLDTVRALLEKYGFAVARVADGEDFGPVRADSPRWIITAVKQYTQEDESNGTES